MLSYCLPRIEIEKQREFFTRIVQYKKNVPKDAQDLGGQPGQHSQTSFLRKTCQNKVKAHFRCTGAKDRQLGPSMKKILVFPYTTDTKKEEDYQ